MVWKGRYYRFLKTDGLQSLSGALTMWMIDAGVAG